eukprot:COSAG01_NODE_2851_length_6937_cov_13.682228_14_plen_112_part_00
MQLRRAALHRWSAGLLRGVSSLASVVAWAGPALWEVSRHPQRPRQLGSGALPSVGAFLSVGAFPSGGLWGEGGVLVSLGQGVFSAGRSPLSAESSPTASTYTHTHTPRPPS